MTALLALCPIEKAGAHELLVTCTNTQSAGGLVCPTTCPSERNSRRCPEVLTVVGRVSLAESSDLFGAQFDVADPQADRRFGNADAHGNLHDRRPFSST